MASKLAREKVALAWCTEATKHKVMDPELAEAFAEILDEYITASNNLCAACEHKYRVETTAPLGWQCPVCGKGLSPYVTECSCHGKNCRYNLGPMSGGEI